MIRTLVSLAVGMVFAASSASASPVYGTLASLTGERTQDHLVLGGNYSGDTLSISWDITDNLDGTFDYYYELTGFRMPGISHVILDLTDDAVLPRVDPNAVAGVKYDDESIDPSDLEFGTFGEAPSNPGFPVGRSITGVKFDETPGSNPMTIQFTSNRLPVWGNFYLKGGSDSFAYNPGLDDPDSMAVLDFIARPNGIIPEPSTLALSGIAGIAGLGLAVRRRFGGRA